MKTFALCVWILGCSIYYAEDPSISEVRSLYKRAATEENACYRLMDLLKPYNEDNNPLLLGYKGGVTMVLAKHIFNPIKKLTYFQQGKDLLQKAIEADENNIELRFLRYTIQTNAPAFLGYDNQIVKDKEFLWRSIEQLEDKMLRKQIISYLTQSRFSDND